MSILLLSNNHLGFGSAPLRIANYLLHPRSWHKLCPEKYRLSEEPPRAGILRYGAHWEASCNYSLPVMCEAWPEDSRCLYLSGASGCSTRVSPPRSANRTTSSP